MISIDRIERIRADGVDYDVADGRLSVHVELPPVEPPAELPPIEPPPEPPPPEPPPPPPPPPPPAGDLIIGTGDNLLDAIRRNPGKRIYLRDGMYPFLKLPGNSNGGSVIVAALNPLKATVQGIEGWGVQGYGFEDLLITAAATGYPVQCGMSDWSHMIADLVFLRTRAVGARNDGMKFSQGNRILLEDVIVDGAENGEGIDWVAINDSINRRPTVLNVQKSGAIIVKGGSTNDVIENPTVDGAGTWGIAIGQYTDKQWFRPGYDKFEASFVEVIGGNVRNSRLEPLRFAGAWGCAASHVSAWRRGGSGYLVRVGKGDNQPFPSREIIIEGCSFPYAGWLNEESNSAGATTLIGNNPAR